jgi:hypothetical protein
VARQRRRTQAQRHIERRLPSWARSPSAIDLLAARRDLSTREPAKEIPSAAAPTHSPIRVARCASERRFELTPQPGEFCASPSRTVEPFSYHILREKRNSPNATRKMKTGERPRSSEMLIRRLDANLADRPHRRRNQAQRRRSAGRYFPLVLVSASLQPSLRLAACDLMHCARFPLPGLTSAQSFFSSALQALPAAAARMIAT